MLHEAIFNDDSQRNLKNKLSYVALNSLLNSFRVTLGLAGMLRSINIEQIVLQQLNGFK